MNEHGGAEARGAAEAPKPEGASSGTLRLQAAVGRSVLRDAIAAGREAAESAARALGGPAEFALVFATEGYAQETLLGAIADALPGARLSGCSAEGVIAENSSNETEHAVAVLAVRGGIVRFAPFLVEGYANRSADVGRAIAAACLREGMDDLAAVVVMPDGIQGDAGALLDALSQTLGRSVPILGGAAGDALRFERTHQYLDRRVVSDAVSGFALVGDVTVRVGVSHGCMPIGLEHVLTRAENGWVYEIDGRTAWSVFREYLDGEPDGLDAEGMAYLALASYADGPDGERALVVRTPAKLDRERGALFFAGGGLETGVTVRLMRRDATLIRESARACAKELARQAGHVAPAFVLQFDCAARGRLLFGERTDEIILEPLQSVLGTDVPWLGFQTYGEIASVGGLARYQNCTVVVCAVFEGAP